MKQKDSSLTRVIKFSFRFFLMWCAVLLAFLPLFIEPSPIYSLLLGGFLIGTVLLVIRYKGASFLFPPNEQLYEAAIGFFLGFFLFMPVFAFLANLAIKNESLTTTLTQTPSPKQTLSISSNTQAKYKDLKIGAGNFWEEEYTDGNGSKKKGLTAGLWFYPKTGKEYTKRVHEGEEINYGGYKINVEKIMNENGVGKIELSVSTP